MRRIVEILLFLMLLSPNYGISNNGGLIDKRNSYPKPLNEKNLLFYIQRTVDKNTVVYELNTDKFGNINLENPIKVYWINYEEGETKEELTFIQQNFSYGVEWELINEQNNEFQFNLKAYDDRKFILKKSEFDGKYHAYGLVNKQFAEIESLFVNIDGGTFWIPNILYVEVDAKSTENTKSIVEYIYP